MPQYGTFRYDTWQYDGGASPATVHSTDRVALENTSLSDGTTLGATRLADSGPTTDLLRGNLPRGDGMYVTGRYYHLATSLSFRLVPGPCSTAHDWCCLERRRRRHRAPRWS